MKKQYNLRLEQTMVEEAQSLFVKYETLTDFVTEAIKKEIELRTNESGKMIDLDGYIEHLQEMGKVSLINDDVNVIELQKTLSEKGYETEFRSSDRDYLVLVKNHNEEA